MTVWSLIAAGLFFGSAALQLIASLQRWVVFRAANLEFVAENHLYDYSFPYAPWENAGTSAQLFGTATLLLALGVLATAFSVAAIPRTPRRRIAAAIDAALGILVAGSFAITGAHALISGITGTPSPLYEYGALGWVAVVGLIILIVRWARRSPAAMMACLFLMGATGLGYFIAAFQIAPLLTGYASHDTTPWTETVVAIWTALAGTANLFTPLAITGIVRQA